ncbi:MAG: GyrI-like domain-containing protein [Candidatus Pristimantibacillus sp.]
MNVNQQTSQLPAMEITGVSTRTTNAQEFGSEASLPQLWETYFQSNLPAQSGLNNTHLIYALYTDYESDASGAYTVIIGHELSKESIEGEQIGVKAFVPESNYMVFTTKKGPVFEVVAQAWGEIWNYFENSTIKRAYTGDFELYDSRTFDPHSSEIQIYIAIQ